VIVSNRPCLKNLLPNLLVEST
jgi:hypothetical protein